MGSLRKWRFLILLSVLFISLILEPVILGLETPSWIMDVLQSLIVLAAMGVLVVHHRTRYVAVVLGAGTLATTWIVYLLSGKAVTTSLLVSESFGVVFFLFSVVTVVIAINQRQSVTLDSVFGAVAGYLLLGLAWSNVFLMLHQVSPNSFKCSESLAPYLQEGGSRRPLFAYYSFVTLSTLGYGDITPVTHAARTLSWAEAVTGQFYIAVLVAGLVSILIASHREERSGSDHTSLLEQQPRSD